LSPLILSVIPWFFASSAIAGTLYEFSLETGRSHFFGDLTSDSSAPTIAFSTRITESKKIARIGLGIHIVHVKTHHSGENFPFIHEDKLAILSFLFTPVICSPGKLYVCGAIGNGTVNVNSINNRQDYGSWNYHSLVSYKFLARWSASFGAKYIGRVEQQINGKDAYFSFVSVLAGITFGEDRDSSQQ